MQLELTLSDFLKPEPKFTPKFCGGKGESADGWRAPYSLKSHAPHNGCSEAAGKVERRNEQYLAGRGKMETGRGFSRSGVSLNALVGSNHDDQL